MAVAVTTGSVMVAMVGGGQVRMDVRTDVVSGESKSRVRVPEHCD